MDTTFTDKETSEQQSMPAFTDDHHVTNVWYAGFWMRLWAYLLDLLVIGSLHRLVVYPVLVTSGVSVEQTGFFSSATIVTTIVGYGYLVFMTKIFQQTLGKMVFGLKVIPKNGHNLSWMTVLFREVIGKFISKTVLFLGYIWTAFSKKKQSWHDKIADTYVIHGRK